MHFEKVLHDALQLFNISSPSRQCVDAYMRKRSKDNKEQDGRWKIASGLDDGRRNDQEEKEKGVPPHFLNHQKPSFFALGFVF